MSFPAPRYVPTNGLNMAIYEAGPADGEPLLLCHGFPELAFSWRHQLPVLAQAGYRVIAMDQRGYGNTGGAKDAASVPLYDYENLSADLIGLLDALEIEKAIFVGHDFGSLLAWQIPMLHPTRIKGLINCNIPFPPRGRREPIGGMRHVYGDDYYIVHFQNYGVADKILDADVGRTLRFYYRNNAAGNPTVPERYLYVTERLSMKEESWGGEMLLNAEELDYYKRAFTKTGFGGGINWYRNFTRNWEKSAGQIDKIDVATLMIYASDESLTRGLGNEMEKFIPDLETRTVQNSGHWTQSEQPEQLSAFMLEWLQRRFG